MTQELKRVEYYRRRHFLALELPESFYDDFVRHSDAYIKELASREATLNASIDLHLKQSEAIKQNWRKESVKMKDREARLVAAIKQTLDENGHLADGDNCTLIVLKRTLKELGIEE